MQREEQYKAGIDDVCKRLANSCSIMCVNLVMGGNFGFDGDVWKMAIEYALSREPSAI